MLLVMRARAVLPVLLLGALGLRLVAVADRLSNDEGYTWLVASSHGAGTFLDRLAAFENTPPLYYLLTWPLPDSGEPWLRLVSVLAGVGCVAALWWTVRAAAGERAALLAAAALAVAPYAVSFSDYARGFILADLGLVIALGAALRRRWGLYALGAAVALYSEYDSALFLVALTGAVAWSGVAPRREALVRGLLPLLFLVPWIPEIVRAADSTGITKTSPIYPDPSLDTLRDVVVRLTFGEHGTAHAGGLRWLQFAAIAAVVAIAFRHAPRVLWVTAAGTLGLHAIAHWLGADVFAPRYLTELIPLGAGAIGIWIAQWHGKQLRVAAAVALAAMGVAVVVQRSGADDEPDIAAIDRVIAPAAKGRTVLTNSAVVAYYLRGLNPRLDRPFGLGPGLEAGCVASCRAGFLVVDDTRVANSPRIGPGPAHLFGPIYVRATRK
jgi:4-amino-4-deoxy-L-arabinose transferase-like glycosyltransferase